MMFYGPKHEYDKPLQRCFIVLAKNFGNNTRERVIWEDDCITEEMVRYWESHLDRPLAIGFSNKEDGRNYYETKSYIKEWGKQS
jgi:hypothetical protein